MSEDKSKPAFARPGFWHEDGDPYTDTEKQEGMTMREYYVGQALAGLCANPQVMIGASNPGSRVLKIVVAMANSIADLAITYDPTEEQ